MKYSDFPSVGRPISKLGFGLMRLPKLGDSGDAIDYKEAERLIDEAYKAGVNYFDTAYVYHDCDSENFAGTVLSKYPRESYCLATKLPAWVMKEKNKTAEEIFEEQLKKCRTDYFDFYLFHSVKREMWDTYEECYEQIAEKKEEGKIKRLGFSYHGDLEFFKELVDMHPWDFVQLQINYYDWENQNAKAFYEILEEKNIPCIVMEPVRGGSLHTLNPEARAVFDRLGDASYASYALRFAAQLKNVLVVLSGMSDEKQVLDNLKTFDECKPLSSEEEKAVNEANILFRKNFAVPCTACRYCVTDCPAGVDIPECFKAYNEYNKTRSPEDLKREYELIPESARAENCINCGGCMTHCPQGIKIPDKLKKLSELYKEV